MFFFLGIRVDQTEPTTLREFLFYMKKGCFFLLLHWYILTFLIYHHTKVECVVVFQIQNELTTPCFCNLFDLIWGLQMAEIKAHGSVFSASILSSKSPLNHDGKFKTAINAFYVHLLALIQCISDIYLWYDSEGGLQLSRRRSIFTFASYLLILSAKISNIPELIPIVKESLTAQMVWAFVKYGICLFSFF